ncbi:MAG: ABC transporter substrate-binding protein [Propionibacteriaceae bacterium]|nr:ABC transporter substrate-binding protein [Propionibacteriaceae bacterium]
MLAIATMSLTACGGETAPSSAPPPPPPSASESATPTESAWVPVDLHISFTYSSPLLPPFVAGKEGIFQKHGLNVTMEAQTNTATATSSLGKQFDMVMQTPSGFLSALSEGISIIAVSNVALNTAKEPNTYVMVANDSPYQELKDLVGKRVGVVNVTSASTIAMQYVAMQQGIGKDDFDFVATPFANMEDQIKAGNIDAAVSVIPYSRVIELAGHRSISEPVTEASQIAINSDRSTNAFFIADKDWALANGEVITRFRAAIDEAIAWIAANSETAMTHCAEMTGLDIAVVRDTPLPEFSGELLEADLMTMIVANEAVGITQGRQSLEGAILP